jgi:hypothetical protein
MSKYNSCINVPLSQTIGTYGTIVASYAHLTYMNSTTYTHKRKTEREKYICA